MSVVKTSRILVNKNDSKTTLFDDPDAGYSYLLPNSFAKTLSTETAAIFRRNVISEPHITLAVDKHNEVVNLDQIFVPKSLQRGGIGRDLIEGMIYWMRANGHRRLEAENYNASWWRAVSIRHHTKLSLSFSEDDDENNNLMVIELV